MAITYQNYKNMYGKGVGGVWLSCTIRFDFFTHIHTHTQTHPHMGTERNIA